MEAQNPQPPFDRQPTLRGERVELRPLRPEDFEDLFSVASDPLIWKQHPNNDRWEKAVFEIFFREALSSGGALIIKERSSNSVIGSSRFNGYSRRRSEVEIGWTFLARSYWGGVFNGEVKALMLNHAFCFVETVIFVIGETNYRSRKAAEKIGAQLAPCRDGRDGCKLVYQITSSCWHRDRAKRH